MKEALIELEAEYPEGLGGDVRYLASHRAWPDSYRKSEIEAAIRLWQGNMRTGLTTSDPDEVKAILTRLEALAQ